MGAVFTVCSLLKVFGSTIGHDLILEFTKEMFTMKQFEQVSHQCSLLFHLVFSSPDTYFSPPSCPPALSPQSVTLHHWLVGLR